jgi:copper chaperone CopZ
MKRGLVFLSAFVVILAVSYGLYSWKANAIEMTSQEASLTVRSGEKKVMITDLGMVWTGCEATVVALMEETNGITAFYVNLDLDRVTLVYDPDVIQIDQIKQRILDTGGKIGVVEEVEWKVFYNF